MNYRNYLRSPQWGVRRQKALFDANYRCELCGASERPLHVHHSNYERVGRELDSDVVVLCDRCHWWVHVVIWPKLWWVKMLWWLVEQMLNRAGVPIDPKSQGAK